MSCDACLEDEVKDTWYQNCPLCSVVYRKHNFVYDCDTGGKNCMKVVCHGKNLMPIAKGQI